MPERNQHDLSWLMDLPLPGEDGATEPLPEAAPQPPASDEMLGQAAPPIPTTNSDGEEANPNSPSASVSSPEEQLISASVISTRREVVPIMFNNDPDSPALLLNKLIAMLVVLCLSAVILAVILRDPIYQIAKGWTVKNETELQAEREAARYEALESEIVYAVTQLDERTSCLLLEQQKIAFEIEERIGASVAYLARHPEERPRYLNEAILASDTIATHWSALCNAVTRTYPSLQFNLKLEDIRSRIDAKLLRPSDRRLVAHLVSELDQEERFANKRTLHLSELVENMDARRFGEDLQKLERSRRS